MTIRREREGAVEIITINRPEVRNAIDPATTRALDQAFEELEGDDAVRAVVLTGAGDKAFCAGVDLKALDQGTEGFVTEKGGFAGITQRDFPKPLIAAVNGTALGGGFEIVLACDLIVAAEHATFGFPEVKLGLIADGGGLIRLPHWLPLPVAKELVLLGEPMAAQRALALGLVNRVVPAARLRDEAAALAQQLARNAPLSLRFSKQLMRQALNLPEPEAWKVNNEFMARIMQTQDFQEGPRAFVEHRSPKFRGQ
jgi:enoyl-CoA hydratase/carnithine racemase